MRRQYDSMMKMIAAAMLSVILILTVLVFLVQS
jgi:hypothetical protein